MKLETKYKNLIRGAVGQKTSHRLLDALKAIKKSAPIREIQPLAEMAMQSGKFADAVPSAFRLNDPHQIKAKGFLGICEIERELAWTAVILNNRSDELKTFLTEKTRFERLLLQAKYADAENILKGIQVRFGWSIWLIENTIALLGVSKGLEAHKRLVKALTKDSGNSFFAFYAKEVSSRNENSIEWSGFTRRYLSKSKKWDISVGYSAYLRYKILGLTNTAVTDIPSILAHEATTTYLDLYETLVDLSPLMITNGKVERLVKSVLADFITHDSRVDLLFGTDANVAFESTNKEPSWALVDVIESVRVQCPIETSGLLKEVSDRLSALYEIGNNSVVESEILAKLCGNWRSLPLIKSLLIEIIDFRSNFGSPLLHQSLHQVAGTLASRRLLNTAHVFEYERLSEAKVFLSCDDYRHALRNARELQTSKLPYFKNLGILLEIRSMLVVEGRLSAMTRGIYHGCRNESFFSFIDVPSLMRAYNYSDFSASATSVVPAIAFFLLDVTEESQYSALHCKTAIKQLLKNLGKGVPSEIPLEVINESLPEFVYFLRSVCQPEYLELCRPINSPKSASQERIRICTLLASIDPKNTSIYDAEISSLALKISTEDGMAVVESTRVYVDYEGLTHWAENELKDIYLSYLAHVSAGILADPRDILKRFDAAINRTSASNDVSALESGDLSADGKMKELMEDFGDAFLQLPKFGLNSFLGTRVRHGSLEGYFRGRFEHRKLIYYIDKKSGQYVVSDYWLSRVCGGDRNLERRFGRILADASRSVDELLADAALNRLQIKSKDAPQGKIEFRTENASGDEVFDRWAAAGKLIADYTNSFRHFTNYCIDELFWPGLTLALRDVQFYVTNDLKDSLFDILTTVENFAAKHCKEQDIRDFRREIQLLREDITGVAELVSSWFQGQAIYEEGVEFSISALRDTAVQAAKYVRPNFSPLFASSVSADAEQPINLNYGTVLDVLLIIFVNISKWSGCEGAGSGTSKPVKIDFDAKVSATDYLVVTVWNDLDTSINREDLSVKLDQIRTVIESDDYINRSQSDNGGSGLYRIAAMLSSPADHEDTSLKFGVESGRFFVSFNISRKMLFRTAVIKALEAA